MVYDTLVALTNMSGSKSQLEKVNKIVKILRACEGVEAKYFIRSLEGKLRIGLAERTILTALSRTFSPTTADYAESDSILKQVYR